MEKIASDLFDILRFLLPGFLAAWVFFGLSAYEKASQFERIIQALIFTLAVQFLVALFGIFYSYTLSNNDFNESLPIYLETIVSVISAVLIGLTFALFANKDWIHYFLRYIKITEQTSYPSEWFGAFRQQKRYIVLHLHDERRLYGWPKEWPQSPEKGHFFIVNPSWLTKGKKELYLGNNGVEGILINVEDVKWVEFMKESESNG